MRNQLVGDPGIAEALMNGYGDYVNASVFKDGVTLTLDYVIADQWRFAAIFEIDLDETVYAYIKSYDVGVYDSEGNQPECKEIGTLSRKWDTEHEQPVTATRQCATYSKVSMKPGHYTLRCKVNAVTLDNKEVELTLRTPFELDSSLVSTEPLVYQPSQAVITLGEAQVEVTKVEVHPTITVVELRYNLPDDYVFVGWQNLSLVSDNGKTYRQLHWSVHGTDNTHTSYFASVYFDKPKTLAVEGKGIQVMKKEDRFKRIKVSENRQAVSIMGSDIIFDRVIFDQEGALHFYGRYQPADWDYLQFWVVKDQHGLRPTRSGFSPGCDVQEFHAQALGLNASSLYVDVRFYVYGYVYGGPWKITLARK